MSTDVEISTWNEINTDFDPEEETANFGTRNALETDGNIYEVVTLATIDPSGPVRQNPLTCATASSENVVVAMDSCLSIFSATCNEVTPLLFPSSVETFAFSPCQRFLLAGLNDGSMHFLYLPLKKVLTSSPLASPSPDGKTFVASSFSGHPSSANMILVTYNGQVFYFSKVQLDIFAASLLNGDFAGLKTAQEQIQTQICAVTVGQIHDCLSITDWENNIKILLATQVGVVDVVMGQEDTEEDDILDKDEFGGEPPIKLATSKADPHTVFCLDKGGKLHLICPLTLVKFFTWHPNDKIIEDFVLLEDEGSSDVQLLLTTKENKGTENFIQIINCPSFTVIYRLAVSFWCCPVVSALNQENPIFLEGASDDVLLPDIVTRIRLRGISEGVPEARLARLLKRNKFEEAEKFATSFGLEKEQVYRAKSAWLVEQLSPWRRDELKESESRLLITELKTCLGLMKKLDYIVECCVTAPLPSLVLTRELLLYARSITENKSGEVSEKLLLRVGRTLHRLETFGLLNGTKGEDLVYEWMDFNRANMLCQIEQTLTNGELTTTRLLWIRHLSEFKQGLDLDDVTNLLSKLPESLELDSILRWLKQFLPDILHLLPSCLPLVADWTCGAVRALELGRRKEWPQNGLIFAKTILETMTFGGDDGNRGDYAEFMSLLVLNQQRSEPDSPLSNLIQLINDLEDLVILHKKYRIKLKLADFQDHEKFNVVALILDWISSPREINPLMDNFLAKFVHRCGLDLNKSLSQYIKSLLECTDFTWHWHIGAAPWEEKVSAILFYITSVEDKLEVILEAVKNAPVPWSKTIDSICQAGMQLQHVNAVLIKEQSSLVNVKSILRKYECKSYTTSGREAERLLQFLMMKGGFDGFKDAKDVCNVIGGKTEEEMIEMYVEHLIRDEKDSRSACKFIQNVAVNNVEKGVELCRYFIDTSTLLVRLEIGIEDEKLYMEVLKSVISMLDQVKDQHEIGEIIQKAESVQRAFSLKIEFGLKTRETDCQGKSKSIEDEYGCKELLNGYIISQIENLKSKIMENVVDHVDLMKAAYSQLMRFCDLTHISHEEGLARIVLGLAGADLFKPALKVAEMLKDSPVTTELAESLYSVIHRLEGELAKGVAGDVEDLLVLLDRMIKQTLTYCSSSSLVDSLELFSWQGLTCRVQMESHSRKTFNSQGPGQDSTDGVYDEWRFSHLYKDKGLPLEKVDLLTNANLCLTSLLPCVEERPLPFLPRNNSANLEIQDLDVTSPDLEAEGNGVNAKNTCITLIKSGQELVSQLQLSGHVLLGFDALQRVEAPLSSLLLGTDPEFATTTQSECSSTRSHLVSQLVARILSDSKPDLSLGLGFISSETKRNALGMLAKVNGQFGLDYRKISSLALVGVEFCRMQGLAKQADQFSDLYIRACWGKRTSELNISFKNAFSGSKTERINILKEMVSHPEVDIITLTQFSRAFSIDLNLSLTLYSEGLLSKLEPKQDERGEISVDNLSIVLSKVHVALELITNDEVLFEHLQCLLANISPYNFEVLEFVLSWLYKTTTFRDNPPSHLSKADRVLGFLQQYRRVSLPQPEYEVDPWVKDRGVPFPAPLAARRLPLMSLVTLSPKEKFKLLEKEFDLETYSSWVTVSKVLSLTTDNICYFAVKNTVTAILEKNVKDGISGAGEEWIMGHVNKSMLESIQTCIKCITDPRKACAASHWVLNRLPRGADKVLASQGAEETARGWCETEGGASKEAQDGLQHSIKIRKQLETEEVLHRHGLAATSPYMELVQANKPLDLVFSLFEDLSIEERNKAAAGLYPDIMTAAESVAEINGLNIIKIKYELLDKWLPLSNSCSNSANDTMADFTLDLGNNSISVDSTDEVNLLRCVYLLQGGFTDGLQYLLKYAFSADSMVSTSHKLRALKCLFSICREEQLQEVTGKHLVDVQTQLRNLVYLARLEGLQLPYNEQSLANCTKSQLVEGVWRTCKHTPEGVTLVTDICVEFDIWSSQLWAALLEKLKSYSMLSQLRNALTVLNSQPHLWNLPQFLSAWNYILIAPFQSLLPPLNQEQLKSCRNALRILHFCPTVGDLDLNSLAKECLRLDQLDLAYILVPYLSCIGLEKYDEVLKEIEVNVANSVELPDKMRLLESEGFPSFTANKEEHLFRNVKLETSPAL